MKMDARSPLISQDIMISDESGNVSYNGSPIFLALSTQSLILYRNTNKTLKSIGEYPISSIVGCVNKSKKRGNETVYYIEVYAYLPVTSFCCSRPKEIVRQRKQIDVFFGTHSSLCQRWTNAINSASAGVIPLILADNGSDVVPPKEKQFLVFVNPVSRKGTAVKIWNKAVCPMLTEANVKIHLVKTEYANHAKEMVTERDLSIFDAILVVSGDGLLFEVINGVANRPDSAEIFARLPICPIPGGTGNGLAKSILFESGQQYNATNATFTTIKGTPHPLDLSRVVTRSGQVHYSFLILGWGLISDIDILSESMRFLGELRLYLAAVYFIFRRHRYKGRLRMKLAPGGANSNGLVAKASESNNPVSVPQSTYQTFDVEAQQSQANSDNWLTIEDTFTFVWVLQTSHAAATMHSGPGCTIADGLFTIFLVREISTLQSLHLLLVMDEGGHIGNSKVERYQATEYSLEPLCEKGMYSLDGELIEYGPIQATMMPSAMKVLNMPTSL